MSGLLCGHFTCSTVPFDRRRCGQNSDEYRQPASVGKRTASCPPRW